MSRIKKELLGMSITFMIALFILSVAANADMMQTRIAMLDYPLNMLTQVQIT